MESALFLLKTWIDENDFKKYLKKLNPLDFYESLTFILKAISYHDLKTVTSKPTKLFLNYIKKYDSSNIQIFQKLYYILQTRELTLNQVLCNRIIFILNKKYKYKEYINTLNFLNCYFLNPIELPKRQIFLPILKYSIVKLRKRKIINTHKLTQIDRLKEYTSNSKPLLLKASFTPCKTHHSGLYRMMHRHKKEATNSVDSQFLNYKFILKRSESANFENSIFLLFDWLNNLFKSMKSYHVPEIVTYKTFYIPDDLLIIEYLENSTALKNLESERIWKLSPEKQKKFLETGLGAYIAIYTFLLYDRHYENILCTEDNKILNIDLDFKFGRKNFIDTGKIPIDKNFRIAISDNWERFKGSFVLGLKHLSSNFIGISRVIEILFYGCIDHRKWIEKIKKRLFVGEQFDEQKILKHLDDAVNDRKTRLKNFLHKAGKSLIISKKS